jgi:hypothetical protein
VRIPAYYFTIALMIGSAALVVAVGWFLLSAFLGMGTYIRSL